MTNQCSFCKKWFDCIYIIKDANNNTYCEECAKEHFITDRQLVNQFKESLEDIKEGRIRKI